MRDTRYDTPGGDADLPIGSAERPARSVDREILSLAVPAFGALVAEPLFILADTAIVGHLGTTTLAGLSLGSTILTTIVGLCVFLAYATTSQVARAVGAGHERDAMRVGIDGMWLGLLLGVALAAALWAGAPWAVSALGASGEVASAAVTYVHWSAPGLPGMLVVLASTGVLRGLKDTRTPLVVASAGAIVNAAANVTLVYGFGFGIAGSGLGTALTQLGMAAALVTVVARAARRRGVSLAITPAGLSAGLSHGTPLLVRTVTLRIAILLTTAVATGLGPVTLAGHQVVNSVWNFAAYALDALAIAAQALVGTDLGAGRVAAARAVLRRCVVWGVGTGAVGGVLLIAVSPLLSRAFTADPRVISAATVGLVVCGGLLALAGYVFVLDGVLIGAGDGRYLAWAGVATLLVYLPAAWAVHVAAPGGAAGLAWLWLAFAGVFMAARALTTGLRARSDRWAITGLPPQTKSGRENDKIV